MAMVRYLSRLAAVAVHVGGIGIAMSMPNNPPAVAPKEIPIMLTLAPPEPPAPVVEEPKPEPKPDPKPKPVVRETPPPPVPQPVIEPPPDIIASAATSVAQTVVPETPPPPPPPPPPPNPGAVKAKDDYFGRVLAWLERHKRYPGEARSKRTQGTVMIKFVMDRQGRVSDCTLHKTSGYPVLDDAAVKMVQRASPLPPMPKEMAEQSIELVVPVEFYIR